MSQPPYNPPPSYTQPPTQALPPNYGGGYGQPQVSTKSFLTTWLLSLLLGILGVDRFYLGKVGTGILKLVTFGGFGIWALVDLILILTNKMRDKQGLPLADYDKHKKIALIVTGAVILLSIIINGARAGAATSSATAPVANDTKATTAPVAAAPTKDPAVAAAEASASAKAKTEADAAVAKAKADADAAKKAQADADAAAKAKADAEAAAAKGTPGQQNALRKAEQYLDFTAFSHSGLIKQLEFEKYAPADAAWAADHVKADWNDQAAKKAKDYLEMTSFSHPGLVDQLVFEGFTPEQAEFGATKAGI